ncbi:hypothetical protein [Amycolatopsis benzoatilytica]|uniref:hypothetical protein n=1 Tax=Amycolatopsis benzoatilytica TaxID=346045 RepID=UPI00036A4936|nr:hypothetical protein [Amycolatopsis benzoatilytica]
MPEKDDPSHRVDAPQPTGSGHRECLELARRALAGTGWQIERRAETSRMRAG